MGHKHKHDHDDCHGHSHAASGSWCACTFCVVVAILLIAAVTTVSAEPASQNELLVLQKSIYLAYQDGVTVDNLRKRAIAGPGLSAVFVIFDQDGDGRLNPEEFSSLYTKNVIKPVDHIWEDVAANISTWTSAFATSEPNITNIFEEEGEALCLNETATFALYDANADGFLNQSEVFGAAAHIALIVAFCEPAHEELPICVRDEAASWGYGILATVVVWLMSLLGVVFLPVKTGQLPLMQFLLALATGALIGDAVLHIIPEIFGAGHGHGGHEEEEHADHAPWNEKEETHDPNEERLEAMRESLGPALVICLTILVLFLLEKLINKIAGRHGHSHGPPQDLVEEREVDEEHGHSHSHSHTKKSTKSSHKEDCEDCSDNFDEESGKKKAEEKVSSSSESHSTTESDEKKPSPRAAESPKQVSLEVDEESLPKNSLKKVQPLGWLFIIVDLVHNSVDGLLLGFSFAIDPQSGLISSIAILFHEIPKELGTYALLINSGFTRKRALVVNFMAGITMLLGAIIGLSIGSVSEEGIKWIMSYVAGSFLYLAICDILPHLHEGKRTRLIVFLQALGLILGFLTMLLIALFEEEGEAKCKRA